MSGRGPATAAGILAAIFAVGCAQPSAPIVKGEIEIAYDRAVAAGPIVPVPPHCPFKEIPKLKQIGGTEIYYAVEAPGDLFWHKGSYYWVYHSQWFRSRHWGSDWRWAEQVPGEFLRIPARHAKGHVVRWHPAHVRAYGYRLQGGGRFAHDWWNPSPVHTPEWLEQQDREREERERKRRELRKPVPEPGPAPTPEG